MSCAFSLVFFLLGPIEDLWNEDFMIISKEGPGNSFLSNFHLQRGARSECLLCCWVLSISSVKTIFGSSFESCYASETNPVFKIIIWQVFVTSYSLLLRSVLVSMTEDKQRRELTIRKTTPDEVQAAQCKEEEGSVDLRDFGNILIFPISSPDCLLVILTLKVSQSSWLFCGIHSVSLCWPLTSFCNALESKLERGYVVPSILFSSLFIVENNELLLWRMDRVLLPWSPRQILQRPAVLRDTRSAFCSCFFPSTSAAPLCLKSCNFAPEAADSVHFGGHIFLSARNPSFHQIRYELDRQKQLQGK